VFLTGVRAAGFFGRGGSPVPARADAPPAFATTWDAHVWILDMAEADSRAYARFTSNSFMS